MACRCNAGGLYILRFMRRILIPQHISDNPLPRGALREVHGATMGTTWSVHLADGGLSPASSAVLQGSLQSCLDALEAEMSHWRQDSALGRFNRAPAGSWHRLSHDFFTVLSYALEVAADSGGAYDPAAGALVNLWGFGPQNRYDTPEFVSPSTAAIAQVARQPRWNALELDVARSSVRQPGGAQLDLSAVAKGYAVDKLADYLRQQGVRHYLIDIGGELCGAGMKPDGQPWWVELEAPYAGAAAPQGDAILLALHGLAVATSGDYRQHFTADGRRYPHTLDPRCAHPITNGVASVTVIHDRCMAADALSTALTVMGVELGMRFADARGLTARFLVRRDDQLDEHLTRAFRDLLQ